MGFLAGNRVSGCAIGEAVHRNAHSSAATCTKSEGQAAPTVAFEVPAASAVAVALANVAWDAGLREAWENDMQTFRATYEQSNERGGSVLQQNSHVAFLSDLQLKRNAHLLPAFLEQVFRTQTSSRTGGTGSQSFASTRLIALLQVVFDVIPADVAKGTLRSLYEVLEHRLTTAATEDKDSRPVMEAFTYVSFLTSVMTAVRMCPSTQLQPMAPLRWLGLAGRAELAEADEATALAQRLLELQPSTAFERSPTNPLGSGNGSVSTPGFRADMTAVAQALGRAPGAPPVPPGSPSAGIDGSCPDSEALDAPPPADAPLGAPIAMPHQYSRLSSYHKWTRDFAETPFFSPFGRQSYGSLLPPPVVFKSYEWRREPLSWPVAGVHCAFDEAATLLLTSEHPTFFSIDSESFTRVQMLRYLWHFADDPSAGGLLDDNWGLFPQPEVSDNRVSGADSGISATSETPGIGGIKSQLGNSDASAKPASRRRARQQQSSKQRHKNYTGPATQSPEAQQDALAREMRSKLDERLGRLSQEEKTAIIERQDPALVARNPTLALAQAEYEAMRAEEEAGNTEGGASPADAKLRLAQRLHGVRGSIADSARALWSPTDSPTQRRRKVVAAVHQVLQAYNYALIASWMDIYFLTGNKEALEAVHAVGSVWTRFGALPFATKSDGTQTGAEPASVEIKERDVFGVEAILDRSAAPLPLAQDGAEHTYPDGVLALEASRSAMFMTLVLLELEPELLERCGNQLFGGVTSRYQSMRKVQSDRTQTSMRGVDTVHGHVAFAPVCEQSLWVEHEGTQPGDVLSRTRTRDSLLRASADAGRRRQVLYGGPAVQLYSFDEEEEAHAESKWAGHLDVDGLGWRSWSHAEEHGAGPGVLRAAPETITGLYTDTKERTSAWPAYKSALFRAVARRGMYHRASEASIARRKQRGLLPNLGDEDIALTLEAPNAQRERDEIVGEPTEDPEEVWTPGNARFGCNFGVERNQEGRVDPGESAYRERAWAVARPAYEGEVSLYMHHVLREFVLSKVDQTGLIGHESTLAGSGVFGQRFRLGNPSDSGEKRQ